MPARAITLGLLALLLTSAAAPLRAETWRLPLTVATADGCRWNARYASLLDRLPAAADGVVALDALQPTRWSGRQDRWPVDREGLVDAGYVSYDFLVPAAGEYTIWVRVVSPQGHCRFAEVVNGNRIAAPFDEVNEKEPQPAHWVRRPRTRLRAGLNRLGLVSAGWQMPRFAGLLLVADDAREIEGDPPAPVLDRVPGATVETAALTLPEPGRVVSLEGVPQGLAVSCAVGDQGQWQPFPAGGLAVDGATRFRLELSPAAREVGPLTATVELPARALVRLRHGDLELLFDGKTGSFFLLRDAATDTLVAGGARAVPWAAVDFKRSGEAVWTRVGSESVTRLVPHQQYNQGPWQHDVESTTAAATPPDKVAEEDGGLTIQHTLAADGLGRARVTQRIEPNGPGKLRLAVTVEPLAGPADVVAITFPQLDGVRLGGTGLDDEILRLQSFGHHAVMPGRNSLRDATYCGGVVTNWTQVYDGESSLYLGVHDPAGTTTLHGSTTSGVEGDQVGLFTRRLDDLPAGQATTWEVCLQVGSGGWHDGAGTYGTWFTAAHGPADYPDWLRTSGGWLDLQLENYGRSPLFERLPDWLTVAHAVGFDWLQVWGQFAYDGGPCCSAWYGPSPLYGGAEGWRKAAHEVTARGGHIGGYFHYEYLDLLPVQLGSFLGRFGLDQFGPEVLRESAEWQNRLRAVTDPANVVPPVTPAGDELDAWRTKIAEHQQKYDAGERAEPVQWWVPAWVPDPEWRDRMADWIADRYVADYGCNTAYIDVLGTGNAVQSYDPRRGHNGDGAWGDGRRLEAKEVVERSRAHDPSFALSQEGLGDLPGLFAAPMCSGVYYGGRDVYRYMFPDRVLIHGMANSGSGGTAMDRFLTTFQEAMRFDIVGRPSSLPVTLLDLIHPFAPELWQGTFRDTVGLQCDDERLGVRRLECSSGDLRGNLLTITNRQAVPDAAIVVDPQTVGPVRAAFAAELDGTVRKLLLANQAGRIGFLAPTSTASLVLLAGEGTAGAAVWPVAKLQRVGEPAVEVSLLNLRNRSWSGTCALRDLGLPEPFADHPSAEVLPLATDSLPATVPAFALQTVRFPLRSLVDHRWSARLAVELGGPDGTTVRREALLMPLVLDGSFEFQPRSEAQAAEGRHALELGPTIDGFLHELIDLWLLPQRRYRLSLQARRTGFKADVSGVLLRLHKADESYVDYRWSLDAKRPDEWQQLGGDVATPPDLVRAALYLYNVRSPDTAWYDDIQLDDLGPAP